MTTRIQIRRGAATLWTAADPILAEGELAAELDTGRYKIGDGLTSWNALPYSSGLRGETGPQGPQGIQGMQGEQGPQGIQGVPGVGDMLKADNLSGLTDTALARTNLGLGNVNNTSDAGKPVSSATQTALSGKADSTHSHNVEAVTGLQTALDGKSATDHTHTGVYEPADGTILKSAAIGVTVQGYDADLAAWAGIAPSTKQDALVSGTNIKTVNGISLLGAGNLVTDPGTVTAVAALNIDCSLGSYFTKTINGNSTFTFSNVPAGKAYAFTFELTHTSGTVMWPTTVRWPGNTAPSLTTGKTHLFVFVTDDGGMRWRGVANTNYVT